MRIIKINKYVIMELLTLIKFYCEKPPINCFPCIHDIFAMPPHFSANQNTSEYAEHLLEKKHINLKLDSKNNRIIIR